MSYLIWGALGLAVIILLVAYANRKMGEKKI